MSRDSTGNYSSPSGDFIAGTVIDSNVMNGKLQDIGSEVTDSLSRSGKGGMLARLRGVDGTINLPAYAFTSESTLGLYRAGSGDIRMSKDGTDLQKWSIAEVRVYSAAVFEDTLEVASGLTVFAPSNSPAITATGTGTGDGIVATGGATGDGGTFSGGASSGRGVVANGVGSSSGIVATGGVTGAGGTFQGGATSGAGVNITGGPSSTGANITGGSGTSAGAVITGSGAGVGAQIAAGTASTATDPTNALELTNGNLKLSGTAPNSNEALSNTLTPANICKAWVLLQTGGSNGTGTILDGFNVAETEISNIDQGITVTWASAFASTSYGITGTADSRTTNDYMVCPADGGRTTTTSKVFITNPASGGRLTVYSTQTIVYIEAKGRQA